MINALLIVAAIAAISIVERKASTKTKNSAPAFQAADSAMEWVLKQLKGSSISDVSDMCLSFDGPADSNPGLCIPDNSLTDNFIGMPTDVEVYFMDSSGVVITDSTESIYNVNTVRTIGRYGINNDEKVSRALEVSVTDVGPIAWWAIADSKVPGDDGSSAAGDIIEDITVNSNHATVYDGTWRVINSDCYDVSDICMEFDGNPPDTDINAPYGGYDFAEAPHLGIYEISNGTISFWFKANDLSPWIQGLWSKEAIGIGFNQMSFFISGNPGVPGLDLPVGGKYLGIRHQKQSDSSNHTVHSAGALAEDVWYFAAYTFGSNGMKLYMAQEGSANIILADSDPQIVDFSGNTVPIQFAATSFDRPEGSSGPMSRLFNGYMDDIRIYNRQLSEIKINELFTAGPY